MLISLLLTLTTPAEAAAYYFVDAGTRGMARGGAYVAGNRDLTAQYYNPAALINLDSGQVMLNFSLVDQRAGFTRMDVNAQGDVTKTYKTVDNIAAPMKIPSFGIAHHFGVPNTMFALGLHPPYAPDKEYTAEGPQRYTLIDAKVQQFSIMLSAAHQPLKWLTVGAGLLWTVTRANQELALSVCNPDWDDFDPDSEDERTRAQASASCANGTRTATDLVFGMDMIDRRKLNANFGVLIDPIDQLTIGFSVTPPIDVRGKGKLKAKFSNEHWLVDTEPYMGSAMKKVLSTPKTQDDDITVELTMPLVIRGGVLYRLMENLEIEFATTYERWQQAKETLITDVRAPLMLGEDVQKFAADLDPEVPINGPVSIPAEYTDTFSYRLGAEWAAKDWLSLRSGAYFEETAIPNRVQGVSLMDGNKVGYGIGASYHWDDIASFDIAFSQSFLGKRKIRNSELTKLEVPISVTDAITEGGIDTTIGNGAVVGNGDISSTLTMISFGATYYFGNPTKRTH
jgi:long-chain fatty acid transport protein